MIQTGSYRSDIDGLRAIAILLVVLFHVGLAFPGGFVGVDIFFVISGYLITGQILRENKSGSFSFQRFWERRIRRLFPALVVVVLAIVVTGFFVLLPGDYMSLTRSAVYQQMMLANVFFWRWSGYFDGDSELKPLLHMWSLAVEEQFYIFLPVLLFLTRSLSSRVTGFLLTILAVISLCFSEFEISRDQSFAFFMLPARAWELLVGSLICWLPASSPTGSKKATPNLITNLIALFLLVSILIVGLNYRSSFPFPGIYAIPPVLCSAGLIYLHSNHDTLVSKLLENRSIVFVGLVSYSWYLWHWPFIAYANYIFGFEHSIFSQWLIILSSFFIACLSYWYIENPFRKGRFKQWGFRRLLILCGVFFFAVLSVDFVVRVTDGAAFRIPERIRKLELDRRGCFGSPASGIYHLMANEV